LTAPFLRVHAVRETAQGAFMFCPACKTEYPPGSNECASCHVPLVANLSEEGELSAYVVLWKGENTGFASNLSEELQKAGIPSVTVPLDVLDRNSRDFLDVAEKPLFGSAVSVSSRDYSSAKQIKERLLEREPDEDQTGLSDSGATSGHLPELPLKWDPATATEEVRRGTETETLRFVVDALHGVGIPTRQHMQQDGLSILWVRPQDAERAREILSEVLEGRPPE
jgi:hypothetical protein